MTYAANDVVLGRHLDTTEKRIKREMDKIAAGGASVAVFTGATTANGTSGLVPAPHAGDELKFLRGDGSWSGELILPTVTSSVNGGCWLDVSGDTPVPKFYFDGSTYTFGDLSVPVTPDYPEYLAAYLPFDTSATYDACGNTWTAFGSPSLDSGVKKFGSNAVHLPANSGLYADDFLDFSQETWTFDTWIYVRSHGCLFSFGVFPNSTTKDYVGYTFNSGALAICGTTANYWQADAPDIKSTTLFPNLNQWYHFALVKRGSDVFIFVGGTLIRQFTLTEAVNLGQRVYLGGDRQTYNSDIYLDNVRFCTEALWTKNFTPPTAKDYYL